MTHFSQAYFDFFRELETNNNRDWFNANKARFENQVKKPFERFIVDLIDRMQMVEPAIVITPQEAMFRIYRDTRFSADKTPYKNHLSAVVAPGGRKGSLSPGAYFEIGGHDAKVYGGVYMPDKDELRRIREKIAAMPDEFERLLQEPDFKDIYGEILGEKQKRLPKEFMEAANRQHLIFNQSFYFFHRFQPEEVLQPDFLNQVMNCYLAGAPVSRFLTRK
jgi:uncharacterized protein (TIGR02453 family)